MPTCCQDLPTSLPIIYCQRCGEVINRDKDRFLSEWAMGREYHTHFPSCPRPVFQDAEEDERFAYG